MPREYGRNRRLSDLVQRQLAPLIQRDPDIAGSGLITISSVDVSPDLLNATVFVTNLDDAVDRNEMIAMLNEKSGQFRHELAQKSPLRKTPRLTFSFDSSVEYGSKLSALIDSLDTKPET